MGRGNYNILRVLLALILLSTLISCSSKPAPQPPSEQQAQRSEQDEIYLQYNIERGKRLVELGGCSMCHTPKIQTPLGYKPDKDRFLSGYAQDQPLPDLPFREIISGEAEKTFYTTDATVWVGRWGVSFAANLTPDEQTGIGSMKEEDFIEIFRKKEHFSQENPLISPMPTNVYSQLSFFELRSIYIYLQTLPPIKNEVPSKIPPQSDLFEGQES
ncbi:MAG: diheme cytochrome c-553 [Thermodesulfobacteriota bacterium]